MAGTLQKKRKLGSRHANTINIDLPPKKILPTERDEPRNMNDIVPSACQKTNTRPIESIVGVKQRILSSAAANEQ